MKINKTLKLLLTDLAKLGYKVQHFSLPGTAGVKGRYRVVLNKGSDVNPYGYYYDMKNSFASNPSNIAQFLLLMYFKILQDTAMGKESLGQLEPIVVSGDEHG